MTNQIIHDPTRGWLLLTEKWPEKSHYIIDDDGVERYQAAVAHCLSTAIEIAKEDWDAVVKSIPDDQLSFYGTSPIQDHHPYSVESEFEVKRESSRTDRNEWYEYKGPDWMIERERGLPNPNFKYRQIARLVKAKEQPDSKADLFQQYLLKIKEVCTAENYPFGYHAAAVKATIALVDEALATV